MRRSRGFARQWLPRACLLLAGLAACGDDPAAEPLHQLSGPTMGSSYTLKWRGDVAPAKVKPVVLSLLTEVDRTFSTWRDDSELSAWNRGADTAPVPASELLRAAVTLALDVARATEGAFDPTVKPLVDLFRATKAGAPAPTEEVLEAAKKRVGWQAVHVDGETLRKDRPDVALDLDGLVAGLAADRLAERLLALGVRDFMLDLTGEVVCRGTRPDGLPWRIGIVDPEHAMPGQELPLLAIPLRDRALCTSGDYRNAVVVDGRILSHVIDPRTGGNPQHAVVSVTVLARSAALADGLGTALMVLGPTAAAAAIARCSEADAAAWFVLASPDGSLRGEGVAWPEAFALDGRPLPRPPLTADVQRQRERDLAAALAEQAQADTAINCVWVGRRLGYLGRYREAIAELTRGLDRYPDEPHLLRHRGHRYLTVRDFGAARTDLLRAAEVLRGKPDEVEPDGQPLEGRPPHSTLHFNVFYHLGLAHFLVADFPAAEVAWRECLAVVQNDEARVAVTHWLWCALARQGRAAAAAPLLDAIPSAPDVVENVSYLQLCRLYRGDANALPTERPWSAGLEFGVAHRALVLAQDGALAEMQRIAARTDWPSFGVIAAEAQLAQR